VSLDDLREACRRIDPEPIADLTLDLLRIWSPPGHEAEMAERMAAELSEAGATVRIDREFPSSPSVIAELGTGDGPTIQWHGHLDAIDIEHAPPERNGDLLIGRGAADMKGPDAAMVAAIRATADAIGDGDKDGRAGRFRVIDPEQTAGEVLEGFGNLGRQPLLAVGDPEQVADEIERWLDEVGIDGINLLQYHSYDTARDFVELVAPVLRERGRLRREYDERETLRDRIFGAGDRLPDRHYATRYRGGAHLPAPIQKEAS